MKVKLYEAVFTKNGGKKVKLSFTASNKNEAIDHADWVAVMDNYADHTTPAYLGWVPAEDFNKIPAFTDL